MLLSDISNFFTCFFYFSIVISVTIILLFFIIKYIYIFNNFNIIWLNWLKFLLLYINIFFSLYWFFFLTYIYMFFFNSFNISLFNNLKLMFFTNEITVSLNMFFFNSNFLSLSITKFNIIFILLFSFLYPIIFSIMSIDYSNIYYKFYIYINIVFIASYYLLLTTNIVIFYFLYEIILIFIFASMYLTSNSRGGIEATIFFAGWAILGSIMVGLGIIILILLTNCIDFNTIKDLRISNAEIYYLYLLFFFGFGTKLSTWPFWYWLPRAHVEVSTGMSIFLSCILIKLSYFSLFRFQFILLSEISFNICILVTFLCVIDIVTRLINLKDLKAIIAYSSVLHTNLLLTLIHFDNFKIINLSVLYVWGHSLATASLFICVNLIESRYGSRNIISVTGIFYTIPFSSYLTIAALISFLDLPITILFWGEIWLWTLVIFNVPFLAFQLIFFTNIIFIVIFFKIWWSVLFGSSDLTIKKNNDVNFKEINYLLIFNTFVQFVIGLQPNIIISFSGLIF